MGYDSKLMRRFSELAKANPRRVVFGEGNTDNMLLAAVEACREGVCVPVLLGNEEMIEKRAGRLGVSLDGIEIVNIRHDRESERRSRYATMLAEKRGRDGYTRREALEKMFDRNYFGMMMVEAGDADAFVAGTYSNNSEVTSIARDVIGIRPDYSHFATMHIMNTKRGVYYLATTLMVLGFEKSKQLLARHPELAAMLITSANGKFLLWHTPNYEAE
jgi:malate dehydrogenase (oxaloacetate-decarboxylating)(NADP+)